MILSRPEDQPPDHGDKTLGAGAVATVEEDQGDSAASEATDVWPRPPAELLQIITRSANASQQFLDSAAVTAWTRSLRAYQNRHFDGSKYLTPEWSKRSKIFRPKTKIAVRKAMQTAANALFATGDVVKIAAGNEADPIQRASAAIKQQLINYRLDRANGRNAIPWFLISMGACQNAQIHGVCVSMQTWQYEERIETVVVETVDPVTGAVVAATEERRVVERDRPDIDLYPPENCLVDPMANWLNPIQSSSYVILKKPVNMDDLWKFMGQGQDNDKVRWLYSSFAELKRYVTPSPAADDRSGATRRAREDNADPMQNRGRQDLGVIWLYTNFMRIDGEDYVFWSVENRVLLSMPVLVREMYPWNAGERPLVWGYGSLDAHRILPQSKVEALSPLQMEANDLVNLRLDQLKQIAQPLTKVKRGRNVDTKALQNRGPNTQLFVDAHEDIEFDRPPEVPGSAYAETNYINADFDDLAGSFSAGSVQTSRQLNETVGGMKLLAGTAAAAADFDFAVWRETWLEPVLAQIVALEEEYETDETVLVLAGERAKAFQKFGVSEITDDMLKSQATVRVNIGTNGTDPYLRMQRIQAAGQMAMQFLEGEFQSGRVKIDARAVIDEIFGAAGYADAGDRFFQFQEDGAQQPQQPDPAEMAMAKIEADKQVGMARVAADHEVDMLKVRSDIELKQAAAAANVAIKAKAADMDASLKASRANHDHRLKTSVSMLDQFRKAKSEQRAD